MIYRGSSKNLEIISERKFQIFIKLKKMKIPDKKKIMITITDMIIEDLDK
jgi:hypothetical protein